MSIPDELRNIRDNLRSGRFGQREVWGQQLEQAAIEIERLNKVNTVLCERYADIKTQVDMLIALLAAAKGEQI